jgi:putative flippase GtrA
VFSALPRQLLLFLLAGLAQLLLDWAVFVALTGLGLPVVAANLAGRVSGACLGFWLNGRYTFADDEGRARLQREHLGRFVLAWLVLTALSTLLLELLSRHLELHALWLAKPIVEAGVAAISFVVARQWIFRQ